MEIVAIVFFVSLALIIGLFTLKYLELRNGRVLAPALRAKLDTRAANFKELVIAAQMDIGKLPPLFVLFLRALVRQVALMLAALARAGEHQAHRLADFVSYKHRFERRETRSEFLKKVAAHKENHLDTEVGDVQNN